MKGTGKIFVLGLVIGFIGGAAAAAFFIQSGLWPSREETQAVRDTRVLTMTPEQFPARCGNLVSDKLLRSASAELSAIVFGSLHKHVSPDERDVIVTVILPDGKPQDVKAVFRKVGRTKARWELSSLGGYDTGTSALGGLKTIEELYPCTTKP